MVFKKYNRYVFGIVLDLCELNICVTNILYCTSNYSCGSTCSTYKKKADCPDVQLEGCSCPGDVGTSNETVLSSSVSYYLMHICLSSFISFKFKFTASFLFIFVFIRSNTSQL